MLLLSQVMGESSVKCPLWKALVPAPHTLHSVRPEMRASRTGCFHSRPRATPQIVHFSSRTLASSCLAGWPHACAAGASAREMALSAHTLPPGRRSDGGLRRTGYNPPVAQYWLRVGEQTYGPYDADELRRYAGADSLVSSGGDWLPLAEHPDFAPHGGGPARQEPPRRRGCGCKAAALLLVGLPLVAAVLGLGGWGAWRFYQSRFPPFDPHVTLPPYSWKPPSAPNAGFVSPPLDVEPAPGLRIRAEKGALDAPRQFTARRLASSELEAARARLEKGPGPPLAGFDVSCGMAEGDRFRRPVTMAFDLSALGIDPVLWRQTQVVMTDAKGRLIPMASSLEGSELRIGTPHNGPVFVVIGLSTIAGLLKYGLADPDFAQELEGKEWVGITSTSGRFHILWPLAEHRPDDTAETLRKELEDAWKEYAYATSPPTALRAFRPDGRASTPTAEHLRGGDRRSAKRSPPTASGSSPTGPTPRRCPSRSGSTGPSPTSTACATSAPRAP